MSTTITAGPQHPAFRPARIRARVLRALAQLHGLPVGAQNPGPAPVPLEPLLLH